MGTLTRLLPTTILCIALLSGMADARLTPWVDVWGDTTHLDTHFESNFAQGQNPALLGRVTARAGVQIPSGHPSTALMPYLMGSGNISFDQNFWNNIYMRGYGVRIFPFLTAKPNDPVMAWVPNTRLYWEQLYAGYFRDATNAQAAGNATRDDRIGIEIWHEWNQREPGKNLGSFNSDEGWAEIWADISYRETNFSAQPFQKIVTSLQLRRGVYVESGRFGLFEPYGVVNLVHSGATDYFLNNIQLGVGVRVQPWRYLADTHGVYSLLFKGRFFAEILTITYTQDRPPTGIPTSDFRTGIELAIGR